VEGHGFAKLIMLSKPSDIKHYKDPAIQRFGSVDGRQNLILGEISLRKQLGAVRTAA
jgi:hypothetical protein